MQLKAQTTALTQTCLNTVLEQEERDELAIMFATFSFALINILLIFHIT